MDFCCLGCQITHKIVCLSMCVSDGRMRQNGTSLSGGHVTSDEPTPNLALNHPSHTPGSYTGDKHQSTQKRRQLNIEFWFFCPVQVFFFILRSKEVFLLFETKKLWFDHEHAKYSWQFKQL